jgi:hypothetical protein
VPDCGDQRGEQCHAANGVAVEIWFVVIFHLRLLTRC